MAADPALKPRPPLARGPLVAVVAAKLGLNLYASGVAAYGYQADELYYLACARRLDCRFCPPYVESKAVFACRGLHRPLAEIWSDLRDNL